MNNKLFKEMLSGVKWLKAATLEECLSGKVDMDRLPSLCDITTNHTKESDCDIAFKPVVLLKGKIGYWYTAVTSDGIAICYWCE